MDKLEKLEKVTDYIGVYINERKNIREQFNDTNTITNSFWYFNTPNSCKKRLNQIERVLRYLINKQAEIMQDLQRETIQKVMQ